MALFRYRATDDQGKEVKGTIDSVNKESATDALTQLQLTPIEVIGADVQPATLVSDKAPVAPSSKPQEKNDIPAPKAAMQEKATSSTVAAPSQPMQFAPRKEDTLAPAATMQPKKYVSFLSTLRLYAGWLFAWYGVVVALGYYVHMRDLPFDIPFVQGLFLSSLVFSFLLATFLFLLLSSVMRILKGGVLTGIIVSAAGIGIFYFMRKNM